MPKIEQGQMGNRSGDTYTMGYDKAAYLSKIQKISYWRQVQQPFNSIDPFLSKRIDPDKWNRSLSMTHRLSGNHYVWGNLTELQNIPVANTPNSWSQQYIQVPVNGTTYSQLAMSLRTVPSVQPIANGQNAVPSKPMRVVQSIQKNNQVASAINQSASGSNFFSWVKMMLMGGGTPNG